MLILKYVATPQKTGARIGLLTETGALLKRQLRGTWAMREKERLSMHEREPLHGDIVSSHPYLVSKGQKAPTHSINPMLAWISSHSCSTSLSSSHPQMLSNLDLVHPILLPKCLHSQKEREKGRKKERERSIENSHHSPPSQIRMLPPKCAHRFLLNYLRRLYTCW